MGRRYKIFTLVAIATIVLDQITKLWARGALRAGKMVVIAGYFDFELSFNPGSAFGLFNTMESARIFLSVIGLGACLAIVYLLVKAQDSQKWLTSALALVAGGAFGNVIDRILYSQVTDFIVWKATEQYKWPAFNVADAALVVGVGILFLDVGQEQKKAKLEAAAKKAQSEKVKGRK